MNLEDMLTHTAGHAYLVEAPLSAHARIVEIVGVSLDITFSGNPDVYVRAFESLGVDDARSLKDIASTKPIARNGRVFVVSIGAMTVEAQNALLKLLEEPGEGMVFVLSIPRADVLLPTVRSRMQRVHLPDSHEKEEYKAARDFLAADVSKRLTIVGKLLKDKDVQAADELLTGIERIVSQTLHTDALHQHKSVRILHALWSARRYSGTSLSKPLLERIALL